MFSNPREIHARRYPRIAAIIEGDIEVIVRE
jgi:hypothetical protein